MRDRGYSYARRRKGVSVKHTAFSRFKWFKDNWRWLKFACIGLLTLALIFSGYMIVDYMVGSAHESQVEDNVRQDYYAADADKVQEPQATSSPSESGTDNNADAMKAYLVLKGMNSEAAGWLHIDGTDIDYPVAQTENNSYYLTHNIKKEFSRHGCLFLDWRDSPDDLNIIIYGHDMKDGTFFGKLSLYLDPQYCTQHSIIQLNLFGTNTEWQIFAVRKTDNSEVPAQFGSLDEYAQYLINALKSSAFSTGATINENDSILTLSTCGGGNSRVLVQAKRIK